MAKAKAKQDDQTGEAQTQAKANEPETKAEVAATEEGIETQGLIDTQDATESSSTPEASDASEAGDDEPSAAPEAPPRPDVPNAYGATIEGDKITFIKLTGMPIVMSKQHANNFGRWLVYLSS